MTPVEKQTVELYLHAYPDEVLQIIGKYLSERHNSLPPPPSPALEEIRNPLRYKDKEMAPDQDLPLFRAHSAPQPKRRKPRRVRTVLTQDMRSRILEMRIHEGLSGNQIHAQLPHIGRSTIANFIAGISKGTKKSRSGHPHTRISEDAKNTIWRLANEGMNHKQIAVRTRIPASTVYLWMKKLTASNTTSPPEQKEGTDVQRVD